MPCLDRAAIRHGASGRYQPSVTEVEETKAFLGILPIFLCVCIYQMCYDPIFSLLPYPGDVMDRRIGKGTAKIPASSISFANTFGVLVRAGGGGVWVGRVCVCACVNGGRVCCPSAALFCWFCNDGSRAQKLTLPSHPPLLNS
jgi:hypothetical protein